MNYTTIKPGETIPTKFLKEDHRASIFTKCKRCNYEFEHESKWVLSNKHRGNPVCPNVVRFEYPCDHMGCRSTFGIITEQVIEHE